jgi:RNA-directed DNA polymerase
LLVRIPLGLRDGDHLSFFELEEDAGSGIDGLTWAGYELNLERNLENLHARIHRGAYRALPSRRVYIPKPDGRRRPLAIAVLGDKIVRRATSRCSTRQPTWFGERSP